jgi:hypothetical protein
MAVAPACCYQGIVRVEGGSASDGEARRLGRRLSAEGITGMHSCDLP